MSEPTPDPVSSCPSDLLFDEWLAAELPAARAGEIRAHVLECARCRDRQAARERERAAFLAEAPTFADHAARWGRAAAHPRRPRRALLWSGGVMATAAAAAAFLLVMRPHPDDMGERIKGSDHLTLFVQHETRARRGRDGERVHPGDKLRLAYSTARSRHLAIVGVDARRSAARYFPAAGATRAMTPGREVPLDFGVELDDVLGRESIFGVFCPDAIDVDGIVRELGGAGRLPALPGCVVDTITLEKESGR